MVSNIEKVFVESEWDKMLIEIFGKKKTLAEILYH